MTLVSVILTTGCSKFVLPTNKIGDLGEISPNSWAASNHAKGGVDRAWVSRYKDNTLNQLVAEAVTSNPDMKVASERVKQAQQTARLAGASSKVQSSIGLDGQRSKTVFVGFPFGGSQITNFFGVDWTASWEPDIWGRVRAGVAASVADAQSVELDRKAAESSLAARVCIAWFNLCEANQQSILAGEAYDVRKRTLESIRSKFELALSDEGGNSSDLRLAETDLATSLANKAQREGEVDAAKRQLELLLGRYPSGIIKGRTSLPKLPARPPAGLPSELLMRRPDIIAAERRYTSAGIRIKEARRAVYPSFSLTGSTGTTTDQLSQVLSSRFGVWSIGSNITQSLLTGGRVKGEIITRTSREREALAELHSTVLTAFGEVESALAADHWLAKRITEMQKALRLAEDAAKSAESDFADGNVDAIVILTAQTRRIEIASAVVTLRRMQLDNRVNLHLALGGAFQSQGK